MEKVNLFYIILYYYNVLHFMGITVRLHYMFIILPSGGNYITVSNIYLKAVRGSVGVVYYSRYRVGRRCTHYRMVEYTIIIVGPRGGGGEVYHYRMVDYTIYIILLFYRECCVCAWGVYLRSDVIMVM